MKPLRGPILVLTVLDLALLLASVVISVVGTAGPGRCAPDPPNSRYFPICVPPAVLLSVVAFLAFVVLLLVTLAVVILSYILEELRERRRRYDGALKDRAEG
jgi:F0F1-type ATP synthase membrane subunit c/vacuolar-type H+-ATPase subunit K